MKFTSAEQDKINRLKELKIRSGTHSPSPSEINEIIAPQKITIDACFLSNPYATDLFMDYLKEAFMSNHIREYVEHYPSQNHSIAKKLSSIISVNPEYSGPHILDKI